VKRNRFLTVIAVLCVSLFVATRASAKESNVDGSQNRKINAVVFMSRQELLRTAKRLGLYVRRLDLSTSEKARLANLPLKRCGCAAMPVQDLSGSCIISCLKSNGVSTISVASCGAVCSVSLVGCAICAGVSEWTVLGCIQYCAWSGHGYAGLEGSPDASIRPSQTRGSHQAKLLVRSAPTRS
jgi:hypothetical protein